MTTDILPPDEAAEAYEVDADGARALTEQIRASVEKVHVLLVRSYEWKAWQALGYPSWRDYAMAEFGISAAYAYRLLDQARTMRAIESVTDSPIGEISEGQARELAPIVRKQGPEVAAAVLSAVIESGAKPTAAAIRSEAQSRGLATVTTTTRQTNVIDPDTGEIIDEAEVMAGVWDTTPAETRTPTVDELIQADPDVRAQNLRHECAKWLTQLSRWHLLDPEEMAQIAPDMAQPINEQAAHIADWHARYVAATRRAQMTLVEGATR